MKKSILALTLSLVASHSFSDGVPLVGTTYGDDPDALRRYQEQVARDAAAAAAEANRGQAAQDQREAQERATKQQEEKKKSCGLLKNGIQNDTDACYNDLNLKAFYMQNDCRDHGTISLSFSFRGNHINTGLSLPPFKYNGLSDCQQAVGVQIGHAKEACRVAGNRVLEAASCPR